MTWYKKNKKKQIAKQKQRYAYLKEWLRIYKSTLFCAKCGMSFHDNPECCDFHHIGIKKNDIAHLLKYSKKAILREINNCIPLCANCHRIIHRESMV